MKELRFNFNLSSESYSELFVKVIITDTISVEVSHAFTVFETFRTYTAVNSSAFEISLTNDDFNYDSFITNFDETCQEISAELLTEKEVSRMYFGILKEITSLRISKR